MTKGLITSAIAVLLLAAFWITVPAGCANMIPPEGGPRDTAAPVMLNAAPRDSTVNFQGDRIVLNFDEELDDPRDPRNNIIFTPAFEIEPAVTTKGREVTVNFKDAKLQPNTTYVINFGDAIIDITEGNAAKNFIYTFSTGPYLDSLEISGRVVLAENGGIDTTLNVFLFSDLSDTAVRDKSPQYISRLDRNGNFRFRNLPKDSFAIYAIGGGRRYQSPTNQVFAFSDSIVVAGEADSVLLYAYREIKAPSTTSSISAGITKIPANDRRLRVNPGTAQQELLSEYTLTFPVPLKTFDSTKMQLASDSVFNPETFTSNLDSARKEVRIRKEWKEGTTYHLILDKEFATDTAGRQLLKTDTLSFTTKKKADYGSLSLRFKNIEKYQRPVLQFIQNNQVVRSVRVIGTIYSEALTPPGEFTLRIFDDLNDNGLWDPGQFFGKKRQPELVRSIQRTFTIKANWDNEFEVAL